MLVTLVPQVLTAHDIFRQFSMFLVCNTKITKFETLKPLFTCVLQWSMVINMIQEQFSSNENKKFNAVCKCYLFSINFNILNTTIQYYIHTCSVCQNCTSDTCWRLKKMAESSHYNTNRIGAQSVWNPNFILVHLVLS